MTASLHQFLHLRLTQSSVSSGGTGLPEEVWKSEGWNFPGGMLKDSGVRSQETFAKILFLPANECCLFLMNASVSGEAAVSQSPWKVLCAFGGKERQPCRQGTTAELCTGGGTISADFLSPHTSISN